MMTRLVTMPGTSILLLLCLVQVVQAVQEVPRKRYLLLDSRVIAGTANARLADHPLELPETKPRTIRIRLEIERAGLYSPGLGE